MKKRFLSLCLIAAMVISTLSGCGKTTEEQPKDNDNSDVGYQAEVNEEISGTVTVGINSYRNSDFEAVCEAFKAQYPNVEVKPVVFESKTDDALEYLTSMAMSEKALPDILYDDAGPLPTYIQNGWMYPLTSFLEGDAEYDSVPSNIQEYFVYNGNTYALGQTIHSNTFVINEDLVEEMNVDLPEYNWNWEEFAEFLKACTNTTYSGVEDLSNVYNWVPGSMTEGCSIVGYQYETNTFDLEAVRKYVNYYNDLIKLQGVDAMSLKKQSVSGADDFAKKFGTVTDTVFETGKVACVSSGTWGYAKWNHKDLDFSWEYYPTPQVVEGRIPIHVDYCWMTTSVKEENLEAVWAFLRYVTYSKDGNLARLTSYDEDHISPDSNYVYYIPCTTDEDVVAKFESLPYVTDAIMYIFENLENGYAGDPEKTIPGFEDVEYTYIGDLAYDAVTGRDDFSAKMKDAESKANAEIEKHKNNFDAALTKFEEEFAQSH